MTSGRSQTALRSSASRDFLKRGLLAAGYYDYRLARIDFPGLAILCFHGIRPSAGVRVPFADLHVTAETFAAQCALIARCCSPVSLSRLHEARTGARTLPERPVLVTFDDGYSSVLAHALPILRKFEIPAVVFVCTDPIERNEHFWFDAMANREGEGAVIASRRLPYGEWRARIDGVATPAPASDPHRPMTVTELQRLAADPLIEIGAHTLAHPTLALAPAAEQQQQIVGSRERVAALTGCAPRAFAYPYGLPGVDYTAETSAIVREAGFAFAFTTREAFSSPHGDGAQMPRFVALASLQASELAHRLAHSWHWVRR